MPSGGKPTVVSVAHAVLGAVLVVGVLAADHLEAGGRWSRTCGDARYMLRKLGESASYCAYGGCLHRDIISSVRIRRRI